MLAFYIKNRNAGMTKESYLEMCEAMGSDPIDEEMPREYDDFTVQSQDAIDLFNLLPDRWDGMSGTYLGKDISSIDTFFRLLEIEKEDQLLIFSLFSILNNENTELVNKKISKKSKPIKGADASGGSNINVRG